VIRLT